MKLNVRFLAALLVVLAACGAGTHFLHGYQVKRNAGAFLDQADKAEQAAEAAEEAEKAAHYRKEVQLLSRYLAYRPSDTEARARLGMLLEDLARTRKDLENTLLVYDAVLRRDASRSDIRLRAAKLAARKLERYTDALDHLTALGVQDSSDGELHVLRAVCLEAMRQYNEAREEYTRAVKLPPVEIETYSRYAAFLRQRFSDPQAADKIMEDMAKSIPTAKAALALCGYWRQFDRTKAGKEKAAAALAEAQKRAPDDADVLLESADMARAEAGADAAGIEKARQYLQRGEKLHPQDARMYLVLSDLETRAGRRTEALAALRRGLEALPKRADLMEALANLRWALTDLLLADGGGEEVTELIDQMKKGGMAEARLEYLRARQLLGEQRWRDAADLLERIRTELEPWPGLLRHADLLLGRCYENLSDLDQQHVAYRRLVTAVPLSVAGNLGLGATLEALGRDDDALKAYQRIQGDGTNTQVRLRMARLLIRRNAQLARADQQWEEVDNLLDAKDLTPEDAVEMATLRADAWFLRGQPEKAEKSLLEAQKQHPKEPELWIARANLAEQRRRPKEAAALLDEAERTLGDSVVLRLARASQLVRRDGSKSAPALAQLAEGIDKFSAAEQRRLLRGLAVAHRLAEDTAGATKLWTRLSQLVPNDLGIRIALFDLALASKQPEAITAAVEGIHGIEGEAGVLWKYARAAQLVKQAREGDHSLLTEARGLFEEVTAKRPSWPRGPLGLATVEELAGNKELAISRYQQAVELGDRSPSTIRAAMLLLYQRGRFADADALFRKLPRQDGLPADLLKLSAEVSLRAGMNPERALTQAQQAVTADSKDYRDHLWLGQMLSRSEAHAPEAEKSLRRALDLGEKEPETWVALVQHLARTGKKSEAEAFIAKAQAKLPAEKATLALARCYEAVGQTERAKKLYADALAARPQDPDILISVAKFQLHSNDLEEAKKSLTRLVASKAQPKDIAWAQQALAVLLYAGGDYLQKQQALRMLHIFDELPAAEALQEMSAEDIRTRAVFLAAQWGRDRRQEAIRLLEMLGARQPLTTDDQYLLGRIYESIGKWSEASRRMSAALSGGEGNVAQLAGYVDSLLRHNEWATASLWLAKLESKQPNAFVTVQLKARLLHSQSDSAEAVKLIQAYSQTKDADRRAAALLLENIDQPREASALFQQLASAGDKPEAVLDLAVFLGRQGNTAEALTACARVAAKASPAAVAEACLRVLYAAADPKPHFAAAERLLAELTRKDGGKTDLTPLVAGLRNLEGRYAESAAMYRSMLAKDAGNALALNNLAFLMAMHENKSQEALVLLEQARERTGPSATVGDTRAIIYLKRGEADKALGELEELIANAPRPEAYFHRAQAHEAKGDSRAARQDFDKARELKLKPTDLHPLEQPAYQAMLQRFGGR
jgi:tetratricopeptide (TPR) repeat protein